MSDDETVTVRLGVLKMYQGVATQPSTGIRETFEDEHLDMAMAVAQAKLRRRLELREVLRERALDGMRY